MTQRNLDIDASNVARVIRSSWFPCSYLDLARDLAVSEDERHLLDEALDILVSEGEFLTFYHEVRQTHVYVNPSSPYAPGRPNHEQTHIPIMTTNLRACTCRAG